MEYSVCVLSFAVTDRFRQLGEFVYWLMTWLTSTRSHVNNKGEKYSLGFTILVARIQLWYTVFICNCDFCRPDSC